MAHSPQGAKVPAKGNPRGRIDRTDSPEANTGPKDLESPIQQSTTTSEPASGFEYLAKPSKNTLRKQKAALRQKSSAQTEQDAATQQVDSQQVPKEEATKSTDTVSETVQKDVVSLKALPLPKEPPTLEVEPKLELKRSIAADKILEETISSSQTNPNAPTGQEQTMLSPSTSLPQLKITSVPSSSSTSKLSGFPDAPPSGGSVGMAGNLVLRTRGKHSPAPKAKTNPPPGTMNAPVSDPIDPPKVPSDQPGGKKGPKKGKGKQFRKQNEKFRAQKPSQSEVTPGISSSMAFPPLPPPSSWTWAKQVSSDYAKLTASSADEASTGTKDEPPSTVDSTSQATGNLSTATTRGQATIVPKSAPPKEDWNMIGKVDRKLKIHERAVAMQMDAIHSTFHKFIEKFWFLENELIFTKNDLIQTRNALSIANDWIESHGGPRILPRESSVVDSECVSEDEENMSGSEENAPDPDEDSDDSVVATCNAQIGSISALPPTTSQSTMTNASSRQSRRNIETSDPKDGGSSELDEWVVPGDRMLLVSLQCAHHMGQAHHKVDPAVNHVGQEVTRHGEDLAVSHEVDDLRQSKLIW